MDFLMPRVALRPARCYAAVPAAPSSRNIVPLLSLLDETFNELNRAAHYHPYRRPQRILTPRFDVRETSEGYQIEGELPGFDRTNVNIEFTDERTLVINGKLEPHNTTSTTSAPQVPVEQEKAQLQEAQQQHAPAAVAAEPATPAAATSSASSDVSSVKSYQATVEDDFEDLGADTASTLSAGSGDSNSHQEKREEPAAEKPITTVEKKVEPSAQAKQDEQQPQNHNWVSERNYGSFSRTFRFPVRINTGAVRASLNNGLLSISAPKAPVREVRYIQIF